MINLKVSTMIHPTELELADFLSGCLSKTDRVRIEKHLSSCHECMANMVAAHESVSSYKKKQKGGAMKKTNIYLLLAILSFSLSFFTSRYFIQLLVATLLLGIKWVVDSKTTRMLVMIHEAWKKDGERGASRILETLEKHHDSRF